MNDSVYDSPLKILDLEWAKLSSDEKAVCISYRRALLKNVSVPAKLILEVNDIHDRHRDFHIGCMPKEPA